MDTTFASFPINDFLRTKQQVLNWANQFSTCCFLDNHQYQTAHHTYECLVAAGAKYRLSAAAGNALNQLNAFQLTHTNKWLFGHLGYDLKNETEELLSDKPDPTGFPDLFFFVPEIIVLLHADEVLISAATRDIAAAVFAAISQIVLPPPSAEQPIIDFKAAFSRAAYMEIVDKLRGHILRGDCYEINFCQAFFSENTAIDPVLAYQLLGTLSPSPFAAFYKIDDRYLLCASPERYLKKEGKTIFSEPMKGTGKRYLQDAAKDTISKDNLYNSSKDRAENVMVVDLVRNDLSQICIEGSIRVDELYGVYSFAQVHQMISRVSGVLQPCLSFSDIVKKTFPMGSMTGAPKKRVMQLIEQYEMFRRGIFSGALGYIEPGGNFDFNVVIRSILYNSCQRYLSYFVGSGITFYSNAEDEYEECLLKAEAIKKVFETGSRNTG